MIESNSCRISHQVLVVIASMEDNSGGSGVYSRCVDGERVSFWCEMDEEATSVDDQCCMGGDFKLLRFVENRLDRVRTKDSMLIAGKPRS